MQILTRKLEKPYAILVHLNRFFVQLKVINIMLYCCPVQHQTIATNINHDIIYIVLFGIDQQLIIL